MNYRINNKNIGMVIAGMRTSSIKRSRFFENECMGVFLIVIFSTLLLPHFSFAGNEGSSYLSSVVSNTLKYLDCGAVYDVSKNTYKYYQGEMTSQECMKESIPTVVGTAAVWKVTQKGICNLVGKTIGGSVGGVIGGFLLGPPGAICGAQIGSWVTEYLVVPNAVYYGGKFVTNSVISGYNAKK